MTTTTADLVLVVDDFEQWRKFVCTVLKEIPNVIVQEASDGLEAIEKVQQMRPDLVLLDVGLPHLNGIHVAREIGRISPETKVMFLTENRDDDLIEEAFLWRKRLHHQIECGEGTGLSRQGSTQS